MKTKNKPKQKKKVPNMPPPKRVVVEAAREANFGNKYWLRRPFMGRKKDFTPEEIWQEACEYFEYIDNNPEHETRPMSVSVKGKGTVIQMVQVPLRLPYTIKGLCIWMGVSISYMRTLRATCRDKVVEKGGDKESEAYLSVLDKIDQMVFNQQFSGAVTGQFNSNIVARALGLVERQDVTSGGEAVGPAQAPVINILNSDSMPPLSGSEAEVKLIRPSKHR